MSRAQLSFNHALIYVRDVERALKFYRDHLGFRVISKMDGYARLKSPKGRTTLGLHLTEGKLAARTGSIRLYFEVTNLDAFCARLRRRGVKFSQMPKDMPWGWRHAYLDDPDGNEISLYFAGAKRLKAP